MEGVLWSGYLQLSIILFRDTRLLRPLRTHVVLHLSEKVTSEESRNYTVILNTEKFSPYILLCKGFEETRVLGKQWHILQDTLCETYGRRLDKDDVSGKRLLSFPSLVPFFPLCCIGIGIDRYIYRYTYRLDIDIDIVESSEKTNRLKVWQESILESRKTVLVRGPLEETQWRDQSDGLLWIFTM